MKSSEVLLKYALCYLMMIIITWISKLNKSNRLFDTKGLLAINPGSLIELHLAGILWLGLVPFTLIKLSFKTILYNNALPTLSWLLSFVFLFVLIIFTGFRASRQIKIKHENIPLSSNQFLIKYFFVRIIFLCAYELFFRGILLFECIKDFGVLSAIIISTVFTVLIHVFTNKKEMWACIPYGIVLCSFCIAINAVWPAIVLHIALSLAYEVPPVNKFLNNLKLNK